MMTGRRMLTAIFFLFLFPIGVQAALNLNGYYNYEHHWESKKEPYFDVHHFNVMIQHEVDRYRV